MSSQAEKMERVGGDWQPGLGDNQQGTQVWVQIPALSHGSCVSSDSSQNFSELQFSSVRGVLSTLQ